MNISSQQASDGSNTLITKTTGSAGNISASARTDGTTASYAITGVTDFLSLDNNDPYADNEDFATIGNNFIDFTEKNPFGDPEFLNL